MSRFHVGDFVDVIDQNITGKILEIYHNNVVIEDLDSEWEYPESRLEYRTSDLELVSAEEYERRNSNGVRK